MFMNQKIVFSIKNKIDKQVTALGSSKYIITIVGKDGKGSSTFCRKPLSFEDLMDSKKIYVLCKENIILKKNIYILPKGKEFDYWFIDDVTEFNLDKIKRIYGNICLLIQSSPANFQCVLKTPYFDDDNVMKNRFLKHLNKQYGDPKLTGYPHTFRLAGFFNTKEKHCVNGRYPYVNLLIANNEVSKKLYSEFVDFRNDKMEELGVIKSQLNKDLGTKKTYKTHKSYKQIKNMEALANSFYSKYDDLSVADYVFADVLMKYNVPVDDIKNILLEYSPNIFERHKNIDNYLEITLNKLGNQIKNPPQFIEEMN